MNIKMLLISYLLYMIWMISMMCGMGHQHVCDALDYLSGWILLTLLKKYHQYDMSDHQSHRIFINMYNECDHCDLMHISTMWCDQHGHSGKIYIISTVSATYILCHQYNGMLIVDIISVICIICAVTILSSWESIIITVYNLWHDTYEQCDITRQIPVSL